MAWEPTAWAIGGGAEHSPEVARLLAHAATGGAEGIVTPGDLKVQAMPTPGTTIRVAPGAVLLRNRYAGGQQQTYAARNTAQHEVEVQSTSSGGKRSDLVVARVQDPQYGGPIPADPLTYQYVTTEIIPGVPTNTQSAAELNLGYPAFELARIDLPASTGTVQSSHIEDLRKMATPRKERYLFPYALVGGDGQKLLTASEDGQAWPDASGWQVRVPEWANGVHLLGLWSQVKANTGSTGSYGRLWASIGALSDSASVRSQVVGYDLAAQEGAARLTYSVSWRGGIPAGLRGRTVPVFLKGRRTSGPGRSIELDAISSVSLDLEFFETTV